MVTPLTSADTGIGQFPGWTGTTTGTTGSPATVESTSSGQVIEDLDIIGRIVIKHTNVVIRRCRLAVPPTASYYGVTIEAGNTGWVVEDCTIIGGTVTDLSADDGGYTGINASVSNGRVSRCDIERWENGVTISADSVTVEDTLITRSLPRIEDRGSAHTDCLEVYRGAYVSIVGNTLLCRDTSDAWLSGTSALMAAAETGPITSLTVTGNICGGGAYAVYLQAKNTDLIGTDVSGNAIMSSSTAYGALYPDAKSRLNWADNVDVDATWTVIGALANPGIPTSVQPWRLWPLLRKPLGRLYVRDAPTWAEIQRDLTFGPEPPTGTTYQAAGTVAAVSDTSGAVTARLPAAGTTAATSATTGTVTSLLSTAGTAAAQSATSGSVTAILPASGTVSAVTTTSGSPTLVSGPQTYQASGTVTVTSATSVTVMAILAVSGTVAAISTTSGDATRAGQIYPASGNVTASSATTGTVTARLSTAGSATAVSATVGDVTARLSVTGTATAASATAGTLTLAATVAGVVIATSGAAGDVTALLAVAGRVDAISTAGGDVSVILGVAFEPVRVTLTGTPWAPTLTGTAYTAPLTGTAYTPTLTGAPS